MIERNKLIKLKDCEMSRYKIDNNYNHIDIPGTPETISDEMLILAEKILSDKSELEKISVLYIKESCKVIKGLEFQGIEILKNDTWEADFILYYFVEDYVGYRIGFKITNPNPLYLLQQQY